MADPLAAPAALSAPPGATQVVGLRVELPRAVPVGLLSAASCWIQPAEGVRVLAQGEAARLEAGGRRPALQLLTRLAQPGALDWADRTARADPPEPPGPWLGALAFDPDAPLGSAWQGFAAARFVLPELLTWTAGGRHFAAAFAPAGSAGATRARLSARLDGLRARLDAPATSDQSGLFVSPPPSTNDQAGLFVSSRRSDPAFRQLVASALAAIAAGELAKVVVARAFDVLATRPVDPVRLAQALAARHPTCRTFLLRGDDGSSFLGATPELFCSLAGRELRTEALAGSAPPAEARNLLGRQKDLREHRWVVEHLLRGLSPLADAVSRPPEPGLRLLTNVAHLTTPITAQLRAGVDLADVVAALHPTPATCGEPAGQALRFLARREQLSRGLYAGLVGLVGAGKSELCVALRCALVDGRRVRAFAGAGIVDGSDASAELRETELKSAALLGTLAAAGIDLEPQA